MTLRDRILRREPTGPSLLHLSEAAHIIETAIDGAGQIRPELLVDRLAEVLAERDTAAATLDAANRATIASLKAAAGVPQDATVIPAGRSAALKGGTR